MKIYIASRFSNKEWIRSWIKHGLPERYEVVSTWHDLEDSADGPRIDAAKRDLRELDQCDAVVVITHKCEAVPGGMHFEAGYAYAKGKKVYLIGPPVNIFYDLVAERPGYDFYRSDGCSHRHQEPLPRRVIDGRQRVVFQCQRCLAELIYEEPETADSSVSEHTEIRSEN